MVQRGAGSRFRPASGRLADLLSLVSRGPTVGSWLHRLGQVPARRTVRGDPAGSCVSPHGVARSDCNVRGVASFHGKCVDFRGENIDSG